MNGIFYAVQRAADRKNVFNLGHDEFMNVLDLAEHHCRGTRPEGFGTARPAASAAGSAIRPSCISTPAS